MPIRTVGRYLPRWRNRRQRSIRKAYESYEEQPAEVERSIQKSYSPIQAQAKAENAEIYWGGEVGITMNGNVVRGYVPGGKTPERRLNAHKGDIS